jgi:hypothetical protein
VNAFDSVERRYMEGGYGSKDIARVFGGGVVRDMDKHAVGWRDAWSKKETTGE